MTFTFVMWPAVKTEAVIEALRRREFGLEFLMERPLVRDATRDAETDVP